jgi:hypothetical protein
MAHFQKEGRSSRFGDFFISATARSFRRPASSEPFQQATTPCRTLRLTYFHLFFGS